MYIDKELVFSDAQDETTVAEHVSDNVVDTVVLGRSIPEMYLVIRVNTTVTSDGSATVAFKLITSASENMGTPTILHSVAAVAKATLVAGYQVCRVRIPQGALRYLAVCYTPAVAALTAGAFDAFLVAEADQLTQTS